jgi:hypothetical protein
MASKRKIAVSAGSPAIANRRPSYEILRREITIGTNNGLKTLKPRPVMICWRHLHDGEPSPILPQTLAIPSPRNTPSGPPASCHSPLPPDCGLSIPTDQET